MTLITNQRYCPKCGGRMDFEGYCHTCGYEERQYSDGKADHPPRTQKDTHLQPASGVLLEQVNLRTMTKKETSPRGTVLYDVQNVGEYRNEHVRYRVMVGMYNDRWYNGVDCDTPTSGFGEGFNTFLTGYDTKDDARRAGLRRIIRYLRKCEEDIAQNGYEFGQGNGHSDGKALLRSLRAAIVDARMKSRQLSLFD